MSEIDLTKDHEFPDIEIKELNDEIKKRLLNKILSLKKNKKEK